MRRSLVVVVLAFILCGLPVSSWSGVAVADIHVTQTDSVSPGEGSEPLEAVELNRDPASENGSVEGEGASEDDDSAEGTVRKVMFALIVVGVLLMGLTIYYWRITRPQARSGDNRYERGKEIDISDDGDEKATVKPWPTD